MTDPSGLDFNNEEIEALIAPIKLGPVSGEWITALDALQFIEKKCGVSRDNAIPALCRRAPIAIPVNCVSWSIQEEPHEYIDRFDYFKNNKRKNDHFQRTLSRMAYDELLHFFEAIGSDHTRAYGWEIEYTLWETGDFKVHLERDFSVLRFGVVGLQFDRIALERSFTGRTDIPVNIASEGSRRVGGRPQSAAWPNWIAELVHYIHESGYPEGEGAQGQEAIINAVADAMAARGLDAPSRSTVQAAVRAVLDRFRHA